MKIELDHVFAFASRGAPETEQLIRFGLHEGHPNEHSGQGTSSRRFSFANSRIELLWVGEPQEAQSEATRRTYIGRDGRREKAGLHRSASAYVRSIRRVQNFRF